MSEPIIAKVLPWGPSRPNAGPGGARAITPDDAAAVLAAETTGKLRFVNEQVRAAWQRVAALGGRPR